MFLKLRKNSMCSVERGTGNGKMKTGKKKKKQKMDNWAKVQVCLCSHFSFSSPRACFPFPVIETARIILYFSPSSVIFSVHTTLAQYVDDEYQWGKSLAHCSKDVSLPKHLK